MPGGSEWGSLPRICSSTKVHNRLLRPLMAADQPPAAIEVRQALRVLDNAVTDYIDNARIAA
jgi:DNA-directed RNA polymerase beta' subunit